jgi:hypothetical protein
VFQDNDISGSKGHDQRPAFDRLHRAIGRRSRYRRGVERRPLGRFLQDLAAFLGELRALRMSFDKPESVDEFMRRSLLGGLHFARASGQRTAGCHPACS